MAFFCVEIWLFSSDFSVPSPFRWKIMSPRSTVTCSTLTLDSLSCPFNHINKFSNNKTEIVRAVFPFTGTSFLPIFPTGKESFSHYGSDDKTNCLTTRKLRRSGESGASAVHNTQEQVQTQELGTMSVVLLQWKYSSSSSSTWTIIEMDWILRNPWEYNRNPFFALNCSNPAFGAGWSYVWISGRTTKYVRRKENRTGLAATCTPSRGKTHLNIRFLNLVKLWRKGSQMRAAAEDKD